LTYCFEADSTFHEYAERSKKAGLVGRIGFSYPESLRSEPEKIRPGFEWLAAVLGRSGMGLMCDDISNAEGNQKLLRFHWEMKRFSKDFGNGVVSALTRLSDRYIPMLSGCYFASLTDNGVGTFVIPLFKGEKCKVMTEKDRTTWSQAELMKARRYRLWSFVLLLGTILLLSPFWYLAICQRAFDSGHIAILAVLGIGWILVFLWKDRQRG
jgi:hypothetical protein